MRGWRNWRARNKAGNFGRRDAVVRSMNGFLLAVAMGWAQMGEKPGSELYREMERMDAAMFGAYNRCELTKFRALLEDDTEFYHDQGGVMFGGDAITKAVEQNICGKTERELVKGTLRVYEMKGFGAMVQGMHRFRPHGEKNFRGEAQFVHLWRKKDGVWKVTRVISFDHRDLGK